MGLTRDKTATALASRARVADWLTDSLARCPSGWLARRFYRDPRPHFASFAETLAVLALGADDRLLEIGCGGGVLLERALRDAGSANAIDHSAEMVALASERNAEAIAAGRLTVEQAEAERLPFADGEFTAAALTNVFFFLYEPERVLDELHRVLVSGGRLAIRTDARAFHHGWHRSPGACASTTTRNSSSCSSRGDSATPP
jgi:SAM-dependent methyltransferase